MKLPPSRPSSLHFGAGGSPESRPHERRSTYEDLLEHVDWMEIDGRATRVLSLERLIEVKRKLTRPKDQLILFQLEATLDELQKV